MNNQDAIEMLKSMLPEKISYAELVGAVGCYGNGGYVYTDPEPYAIEMAISALEKQIPKKPKKLTYKPLLDFGWRYECPNCKCACGENIYYEEVTSDQIFCTQCGQAIDWSGKDE